MMEKQRGKQMENEIEATSRVQGGSWVKLLVFKVLGCLFHANI